MSVVSRQTVFMESALDRPLVRDVFLIIAFSALISLCARIAIPIGPVPITGQTFGVLLTGALLGSRRGAATLLAYVGEGLVGIPVFAGGNSAWSPSSLGGPYILGPSAGFFVGFVAAVYVVGLLAERGWDKNVLTMAVAMFVGNVLLYLPGLVWLGIRIPGYPVLTQGLFPYIPGDLVKLALAALALPSGWTLLGTGRREQPERR